MEKIIGSEWFSFFIYNKNKKTWDKHGINEDLFQSNRKVEDLYVDLRDGFNLIALLEALSGETLVSFGVW